MYPFRSGDVGICVHIGYMKVRKPHRLEMGKPRAENCSRMVARVCANILPVQLNIFRTDDFGNWYLPTRSVCLTNFSPRGVSLNRVQPEVFSSMGTTMWWAVITFTTVGYGDMYPVTLMGRILTTFVSFLGIAFYAIPGSIFTSALLEKINDKKQRKIEEKKKRRKSKRNEKRKY